MMHLWRSNESLHQKTPRVCTIECLAFGSNSELAHRRAQISNFKIQKKYISRSVRELSRTY